MRKTTVIYLFLIILINFNCSTHNNVFLKNYVKLDFKDCNNEVNLYDYIQINIKRDFKIKKIVNDAFCEYRLTNKDESILYVSSDIYRGSRLNYKNLYKIGIDGYYPKSTINSDTIRNHGLDSKNQLWAEYVLGDVVIGYVNVPIENKEKYDLILSSLKRIKKQVSEE